MKSYTRSRNDARVASGGRGGGVTAGDGTTGRESFDEAVPIDFHLRPFDSRPRLPSTVTRQLFSAAPWEGRNNSVITSGNIARGPARERPHNRQTRCRRERFQFSLSLFFFPRQYAPRDLYSIFSHRARPEFRSDLCRLTCKSRVLRVRLIPRVLHRSPGCRCHAFASAKRGRDNARARSSLRLKSRPTAKAVER